MTPNRATVLAALVAALGLTAMSPAFAGSLHQARAGLDQRDGRTLDFRRGGPGGVFQLTELSCAPRAADRLETRLDRIAGRLDLTAEQQDLFAEFRNSALVAQTSFADECATLRPDRTADLVDRLEQRLQFDEARLTAMTELLPQFRAFYESLTDEQKSELTPIRGNWRGEHRGAAPTPEARP
ncbi:MAG: Spy/CpxP family protein refolding chaperone [Devosia sp.]